ncbi:hypothetical protein [Chryseoglobus sp. 28M-23]|uniref:hypothetical protein n=1 Tax=Chryseoglobus sp. 28M-23 TaxID=2772253 RepID=UPI0017465C37|nr:hypothetical protein [Chryseoglobus sp. 28M-23]QOD93481.1 hypothetical protein IE160_11340 [Chryseoglobus sp. 28M-23]
MSYATLTSKIDRLRERAEAARARYAGIVNQLNADQNLSLQGRREQADPAMQQAKEEMTALQREEDQLIAAEIKALTQQLAGSARGDSSDVINFRDAQDRAARLETEREATDAMERALALDDLVLARAILDHSFRSTFREPVVNLYLAQFPDKQQVIEDLARVHQLTSNLSQGFHRHMAYVVPEARIVAPAEGQYGNGAMNRSNRWGR